MAFEIVNPEFIPFEIGSEDHSKGNGLTEPITFGSHGPKEAVDGPKSHLPKDAVDEWPAAQQVHSFYFVRSRPYDDPKIKAKFDVAEKDVRNKNDARYVIIEKIQALRGKRSEISKQVNILSEENNRYNEILDGKKKEMEPLNQVLSQLRPNNSRDRGVALCSSEDELNRQIKSLQNIIQHESIPLTEEKQILREIKQLEGTRSQVVAIAEKRAKLQESSGSEADIKDQYKLMGDGFSGIKKEKKVITTKLSKLLDERKVIDEDIEKLEVELNAASEKRDKAREVVQELRKKRDEGSDCFYQYRMLLNKARNLANTKDIAALKDISNAELEKFMKMWNESKPFREDYEKRILASLDIRQLSRDGRGKNPDEKPLVVPEPSIPARTVSVSEKSQNESKSKPVKEVEKKVELDDEVEFKENEKLKKAEKKVDEAKLKEMRREEEAAKAKQALERKKKLAEKAAAKAALKAQKEAEKKEKDREKKLKKKALASGLIPEPEEQSIKAEVEASEPEKLEETIDEPALVSRKSKGSKRRVSRIKGPDSISKVMPPKRKKSTNYWVWAGPVAAVSVMMVFVMGYKYLF